MKRPGGTAARKQPVNLTLSATLVRDARGVTDNLSGVVEQLLAEFVARERDRQASVCHLQSDV